MPSNRIKDSVDIYRFRITRKGTTKVYRNGEWQRDDDHEEVEFIGLYTSKYKYEPWIPDSGTLKVEHQKLVYSHQEPPWLSAPDLHWETIESKSYKDGQRND